MIPTAETVDLTLCEELTTDAAEIFRARGERRVGNDCLFTHACMYCMYQEVKGVHFVKICLPFVIAVAVVF